jgi:hypothetical protein
MKHKIAPKAWRGTKNITGDYDLDASIAHGKHSKGMKPKLETHTSKETVYGPKTGYDGYSGYSGDD